MTEESKAKQPDQTSKDSKTDGNPGTKESKTDGNPGTKESKSDGNPSPKAEKQEGGTPRHEGQKMVTDNYRQGWERIWKKKG